MKLQIVGHPERRMRQRGISVHDVEHALQNHHTRFETRDDSITYIGPGLNGDDLKVWVLPPGDIGEGATITVKSAAWKNREDPR